MKIRPLARRFSVAAVLVTASLVSQVSNANAAPPRAADAVASEDGTLGLSPEELLQDVSKLSDEELGDRLISIVDAADSKEVQGALSDEDRADLEKAREALKDPKTLSQAVLYLRSQDPKATEAERAKLIEELMAEEGTTEDDSLEAVADTGTEASVEPALGRSLTIEAGGVPDEGSSAVPAWPNGSDPEAAGPVDGPSDSTGSPAEVESPSSPQAEVAIGAKAAPPKGGTPGGAWWLYHERLNDAQGLQQLDEAYKNWLGNVSAARAAAEGRGSGDGLVKDGETETDPQEPTDPNKLTLCPFGDTGTLHVPTVPTRPGTIVTPVNQTFVSHTATPGQPRVVYSPSGGLVTRTNAGVEEFLVQAHVSADPGFLLDFFGMVVSVERPEKPTLTYQVPTVGEFQCYVEDAAVLFPVRGYAEIWLPASLITEPGFQIRAEVTNTFVLPQLFFFGADQVTVIAGPKPVAHNEVVPHSLGAVIDDGLIVDRDGNPRNDAESVLRSRYEPMLNDVLNRGGSVGLPGVLGGGYDLKNKAWASVDLDITTVPGDNDEAELRVNANVPNVRAVGYFGVALVGCVGRTNIAGQLVSRTQLNNNAANPLSVSPETAVDTLWVDTWSTIVLPVMIPIFPWQWVLWAIFKIVCIVAWAVIAFGPSILRSKIKEAGEKALNPGGALDKILTSVNTSSVLNGVALPNGNGFRLRGAAIEKSCILRGCQGGDVSLANEGLEPTLRTAVIDRKPSGIFGTSQRRFPLVYNPSSTVGVDQLATQHTDSQGRPFAIGVLVNATSINQTLRALTDGSTKFSANSNGVLDINTSVAGFPIAIRPTVAPAVITLQNNPADYALSVMAPEVRVAIDDGSGPSNPIVLTVDAFANVGLDNLGGYVVHPKFQIGTYTHILNCHSPLWLICANTGSIPSIPTILDAIVNGVTSLLNAAIGNIAVPKIADEVVPTLPRLERRGAHLAIYTDVSLVPKVTLAGWYDKPWYGFVATPIDFPGTGPITYQWTVRDQLNGGAVVHTSTTTSPNLTLPMTGLRSIRIQRPTLFQHSKWLRVAKATVVASRGGQSATTEVQMEMITKIW